MDNLTAGSKRENTALYYIIGVALLWLSTYFGFRFFQYYVDPDATSYFNIIKNYLAGNYEDAVNAFWSPMGCWLTVLLVKVTNLPLFTAAIIINSLAAAATLIASQALFFKFRKQKLERWGFTIACMIFWVYATYKQAFTDIWQYFFILLGIHLLLKEQFSKKPLWWLAMGVIAALAYFSKAYSFYFFPLMTAVVLFIKLKHQSEFTLKKWVSINAVVVVTMLAIAFPWLYILHEKYQIWTTSTAGKLNLSWWLVGRPEHRADVTVLWPPPHKTSLYSFEDPYIIQGHFAHFWDSPKLFARFLLRIGFNVIDWVKCCNIISPFYFVIWLLSIVALFRKRMQEPIFSLPVKIIAAAFLIYPCAFWIMTFDNARYLWITIPLSMILGMVLAERMLWPYFSQRIRQIFIAVFFFSYIPWIVTDARTMVNTGKEEYAVAEQIKGLNVKGSFATNYAMDGDMGHYILRVAYFAQCPIYCYGENKWTTKEILQDARRYNVDYYFYFYETADSDFQLKGLAGEDLPELTNNSIKGLKIFKLNNR